ncbi:MAG: hypothetical protein ACRCYO_16370, partial [Bacteroidia bacterium]
MIFKNKEYLVLSYSLSICFGLITLTYAIFSPWRLDSERLESDVVLRACFEGTQNQAFIKLRQDNSFELNWTGAF